MTEYSEIIIRIFAAFGAIAAGVIIGVMFATSDTRLNRSLRRYFYRILDRLGL